MFAQIISLTIVLSAGLLPGTECQRDADRNAFDILRYQNMPGADGNYSFGYKTSNGISVEEKGFVKNPEAPKDQQINVKTGCYSYTTPEGAFVSVVYIADELGYRPKTRITYPQDTARHQQHLQEPCGLGSSPSLGGSTSTTTTTTTTTTASPTQTTTPRKSRGLKFNQGSSTTSRTTPTSNKGLVSGNTTPKPSNTNNIIQGLTTQATSGGSTLSTTSITNTTTTTTESSIPTQDKTTINRQPKDSSNCICQSFTFELFDQSSVVVDYSRNSGLPTVTIYPYGSQNAYTRTVSPVDLSTVQTL
ncbi:unnamed protein product [Allacma fusca]|uniref:Uncharacterized protein n=1 Tax=Allacma fusca TaxID=39272 RepID=A0A8J2KP87_9HEXA|nr:unnamed protein product [Allacma fusca]